MDTLTQRVASRYAAKKTLDLSHYDLDGLLTGQPVTCYHGTTKLFKAFDIAKSRTDLVDRFYGVGIFLVPSKRVAEQYANANRNIGFDPDIIEDLKRVNPGAGAFMELLFRKGDAAWNEMTAEALGVAPEDLWPTIGKTLGGADANTVADVCRLIIGSKLKSGLDEDDQTLNIFNTATGVPEYTYKMLDELGLESFKYRPKVYTVTVTASNPLITTSKSQARSARSKGYDCVVYHGADLVSGVPEVVVYKPSDAKITHVEEA